jgi:frataxin-like iron-binding protein CyaY
LPNFTQNIGENIKHNEQNFDFRPECEETLQILESIFHLEIQTGALVVPEAMAPKVSLWLGSDQKLIKQFSNQTLLLAQNRLNAPFFFSISCFGIGII